MSALIVYSSAVVMHYLANVRKAVKPGTSEIHPRVAVPLISAASC